MDTKTIIELKKPDLQSQVVDVLEKRFSPRIFSDEAVNVNDLKSIFEAARWTPSSYNRQPWQFFYAKKGTLGFEKLASCLLEGNEWAAKAPILILACSINKDEIGDNAYAEYDLGLSVMSLIIQAQSLGLYARQMGWFDKEKTEKLLNLPEAIKPQVIIALGKIGDYQNLDEVVMGKENTKRERKLSVAEEIK